MPSNMKVSRIRRDSSEEGGGELSLRDFRDCTALVVDSQQMSRGLLTLQLRDLGVGKVIQCSKLSEARAHLELREFDFVVCEQHFDGEKLSAQSLLDDLRRERVIPFATVFIMLTSQATQGEVTEAAEAALDGFLLKPHRAVDLYERILAARRRKSILLPIFKAIEINDFEDAAALCLQRFSEKAEFWLYSARIGAEILLRLKRVDEALKLYKAILEAKATPWAKLGIARSQLEMGESAQAISTLEDLVTGSSTYADAYDVMARAHIEMGNMEKAMEAYDMAVKSTPGSIVRSQKKAMVAFYMGLDEEARTELLKASQRASGSRLFDYQSLVILAITSYRANKEKDLQWCLQKIQDASSSRPDSLRIERMRIVISTLNAYASGDASYAAKQVERLCAERGALDFDFEAACNLATLLATLAQAQIEVPDAITAVQDLGMRFCGTNGATAMLSRSAWIHEPYAEMLREAHAQILRIAQNAMVLSIKGDPGAAAHALIERGEQLLNFKLIDSGFLVVQRYRERIEAATDLLKRIEDIRSSPAMRGSKPGTSEGRVADAALLSVRASTQKAEPQDLTAVADPSSEQAQARSQRTAAPA